MPSMVRMSCRSEIAYIEDELIEIMTRDAIIRLEQLDSDYHYKFIDKHLYVLHRLNPVEVRDFIRNKKHYHKSLMPFCKYESDGKNITCCSCKRVGEIVDYYLNRGESCTQS